PAPPQFYTLSLHDALPICEQARELAVGHREPEAVHGDAEAARAPADAQVAHRRDLEAAADAHALDQCDGRMAAAPHREHRLVDQDRKSTRLNSSHVKISYA